MFLKSTTQDQTSRKLFSQTIEIVFMSVAAICAGLLLFSSIPASAQLETPDICPKEGCPVLETTEESPILNGPTDNDSTVSKFIIGLVNVLLFIGIALSIMLSPVLIIVGIIAISRKRKKLGVILIGLGPVLFVVCIILFTVLRVVSTLLDGNIGSNFV